ncbi:hypothetical protein BC827DRAFT_910503 [Russula dissimulans]|nr:hypothetical protein BC827DRAFT_910503 [Russula dissimulans]
MLRHSHTNFSNRPVLRDHLLAADHDIAYAPRHDRRAVHVIHFSSFTAGSEKRYFFTSATRHTNLLSILRHSHRAMCPLIREAGNWRIAITISDLLFIRTTQCGDGERRIRNWPRYQRALGKSNNYWAIHPSEHSIPTVRSALDELPTTLDKTYEQTLRGFPQEKRQHEYRTLQMRGCSYSASTLSNWQDIFDQV